MMGYTENMDEPQEDKKEVTRKKVVVEEVAEPTTPTETVPATPEEPSETEQTETPVETPDEPTEEVKTETPEKPEPKKEEASVEATTPNKPKTVSPLWLIIPVVILIVAFVGGIYVYQTGIKVSQPEEEITTEEETAEPTSSPEASPSATPNLSAFTIDVQNGSGIAGEATKVKNLLEKAGFKVGTTGNADNYNYENTVIKAQETVNQDFLTALSGALEKTYQLDSNQALPATSSSEIVVIVGKTKAE
jgi:hypothetical protein